jgi:hypothetical protein
LSLLGGLDMKVPMKILIPALLTSVLLLGSLPAAIAAPAPCSISVGISTRLGGFRTSANPFETTKLTDKGYRVCQNDAILNLKDASRAKLSEQAWNQILNCESEYKLELLFKDDSSTRTILMFKGGRLLFSQDYANDPASQNILPSIPSCSQLEKLAE